MEIESLLIGAVGGILGGTVAFLALWWTLRNLLWIESKRPPTMDQEELKEWFIDRGLDHRTASELACSNIQPDQIRRMSKEELLEIHGIGKERAREIKYRVG